MVDLNNVTDGDRVWIGDSYTERKRLASVHHVTATRIVLYSSNKLSLEWFKKSYGYMIGSVSNTPRITGIASLKEAKQWGDEQAAQKAEQERKKKAELAEQDKQNRMAAMFGREYVYVSPEEFGEANYKLGKYSLRIHDLSEADILRLAPVVAKLLATEAK